RDSVEHDEIVSESMHLGEFERTHRNVSLGRRTASMPSRDAYSSWLDESRLDVEPEMHDVAVLDDVLAALEAHLAVLLRALLAFARDVIGKRDHLGANEPFFEIGVNDAGGLGRRIAVVNRPRADFLRTGGEIGLEAEQLVAGM